MHIGLGLGLTSMRRRRQQIITATTAPVLAPLASGDTIASAYTAGSYASTAGTISSAVATYLLNGVSVPASTVVAEGDSVSVTEAVTDSAGNTRTFSAGSQSVPYIAPTISGLADLSASYGASISINAALMASGSALVYSLTGPAWLSINSATGMITGIAPEADVSTTATVTVTNPAGSASDDFAVTVADDAFTPASLFSSGEQGIWLDPSDLMTLYQDSAGTTPVTAAGQPVGLVLDKSQGLALGPELVTNGDFSNGTTGWTLGSGWAVSGNALVASGAGSQTTQTNVFLPGVRRYLISFEISNYVSGALTINAGSGTSYLVPSIGNKTVEMCVTNGGGAFATLYFTGNNFTATIDNISVRELPGYHATQPVASRRPTLGRHPVDCWYLYTDPVDDALTVTVPIGGWANATIALALDTGVTILTGQTIPAGTWTLPLPRPSNCYGVVVVNRDLTAGETERLTAWLDAKRGV